MDPSCVVTTVQAGDGGVMVWRMFSWHTLGPLVPIGHSLNAMAYLSIVSDHVYPFMTTMYQFSDGYFQQATSTMPQSSNYFKLVFQNAILSIWAIISKECFQHLVELIPCRIKAVLKV